MTLAALLTPGDGLDARLLTPFRGRPLVASALAALANAGIDDAVIVTAAPEVRAVAGGVGVRAIDADPDTGLAAVLAEADRHGHDAVVVAFAHQPLVTPKAWNRLARTDAPVAVATYRGRRGHPVRLGRAAWPDARDAGLAAVTGPDIVEVACDGSPDAVVVDGDLERLAVAALLGREPQGGFEVVVRRPDGDPVVIRCAPILDDGRPMPTRHWLVGDVERIAVSRLESAGGVRDAEAAVPADLIAATHARAEAERRAATPAGWDGPVAAGGVGGTRRGVKCLHAHYAEHLAGVDDPVGRWVAERLAGAQAPRRRVPAERDLA